MLALLLALGALCASVPRAAAQPEPPPGPSNQPVAHAAANIDMGCPSPPGGPGGQSLWLKVTHWCGLDAPRRQWQIKIQLRITGHQGGDGQAGPELGASLTSVRVFA